MAMTTSPLKLFLCICVYFYLTLNLFYFMAFDDILHGFSIYCWTQTLVMFFLRQMTELILILQIVTASYTDLQDYTYYFVPAPWLSVKLLRLLQNYPPPGGCLLLTGLFCCSETHPPPNFMSFTTYLMLVVHIVN